MSLAVAAIVMLSLTVYALSGGADFGGGVWDLFARGPRKAEQRALITHAIGPIWEANHVWLILVVVLLFTCFPSAFARLVIVLHVPLTLMLIGIVLRGSAFTFRAYDSRRDAVQRRWGRIFAVASVVTPVLLGICIGAIVSGAVGSAPSPAAGFRAAFIAPWLTAFSLGVGAMALALFAFLAAVYLTVETDDAPLQEDFRRRALAAAGAVFVTAALTLLLSWTSAPRVREALMSGPLALMLHLATAVAAVSAIWGLVRRQYRLARLAAAAQVALILWGWGAAQYPFIVPPTLTIADSAPPLTLRLTLIGVGAGFVVLVPSLAYLYRVFKSAPQEVDERVGVSG